MEFHRYIAVSVWGAVLTGTICWPALAQGPAAAEPAAGTPASKALEVLKEGETAKDVELLPLAGEKKLKLSDMAKEGPVVLVVLRGYPGYQCPLCANQVRDLLRNANEIEELGAKVVFIYPGPGPADALKKRAEEFLAGRRLAGLEWPKSFVITVDPEYSFTNLYELRWNAPQETSYPSTFVLDQNRVVKFRKVSVTHGDRAPTAEVLASLAKLRNATHGGTAPQGDSQDR
jgi:peroxiredoxin